MNEFELIARLTPLLPANDSVVVGAGDDCAVLDVGIPDRQLLFKTDAVVEGIHFQPDAPPEKLRAIERWRRTDVPASQPCAIRLRSRRR